MKSFLKKRKTPGKGTREERRKDQSPNKRPHPKVQNALLYFWSTLLQQRGRRGKT
jgi:hypothetical protein